MPFSDEQVMLTLAGLAYRGFQDFLPGEPHEVIVQHAVLDGLATLSPVKDEWELVWGPVTSRVPLGVFDSNAMYVVRHRQKRQRYVVAIRGTNPVASSDWLFGDLLVATTVPWPYATDGAAISTSTALGLAMLQDMRSRPPSTGARLAEAVASTAIGSKFDKIIRAGRAWVAGSTEAQMAHPSSLEAQVEKIVAHWHLSTADRDGLQAQLRGDEPRLRLDPASLRRKLMLAAARPAGLDLLTFLAEAAESEAGALDVHVTGHSKGGALAPAVALWLKDALGSTDPEECWDRSRRARVTCYAFAGPTPGNAAFAHRIDCVLAGDHHHRRNTNDLVTHAWQVNDLEQIPGLYGERSALFGALIPGIVASVRDLGYRHAQAGMDPFAGALDPKRLLASELIHQHLDAYLDKLELGAQGISAATFFI